MNQEITIQARMDKKLYAQLKRYAERNDEGKVSRTARRAIKLFLEEQNGHPKT